MDNFDEANNLVREIGKDGEIRKSDYREWPLFREYRKSDDFLRTFEEVFGEPLNLAQVEKINTANIIDSSLPISQKPEFNNSFSEA